MSKLDYFEFQEALRVRCGMVIVTRQIWNESGNKVHALSEICNYGPEKLAKVTIEPRFERIICDFQGEILEQSTTITKSKKVKQEHGELDHDWTLRFVKQLLYIAHVAETQPDTARGQLMLMYEAILLESCRKNAVKITHKGCGAYLRSLTSAFPGLLTKDELLQWRNRAEIRNLFLHEGFVGVFTDSYYVRRQWVLFMADKVLPKLCDIEGGSHL